MRSFVCFLIYSSLFVLFLRLVLYAFNVDMYNILINNISKA